MCIVQFVEPGKEHLASVYNPLCNHLEGALVSVDSGRLTWAKLQQRQEYAVLLMLLLLLLLMMLPSV